MNVSRREVQKDKVKVNAITLILINAIIPLLNTIFASDKEIFFTTLFSLFVLLIFRLYRRAIKYIIFLLIFFGLYYISFKYLKSGIISSMFRMYTLFIPSIVMASVLITEYNSSEILSGLEKLKLPKIFIIGLTVTIRYIPTFTREFKIIKDAMYLRGVKFSVLHPIRTFEYLLVPQLFRCLNLSSELTAAGLTKGISAPNKRNSFFDNDFSSMDYILFGILIIVYGLIIGKVI